MDAKRLTGRGAGVLKYDLLTAIGLLGSFGSSAELMSMARLNMLITARYNWRKNEISVGQRDMAAMWNVTERTVKREVRRWTDMQILISVRKGVRGRVACYRLNTSEIYRRSAPHWDQVGPDYVDRMAESSPIKPDAETNKVVSIDFRSKSLAAHQEEPETKGTWDAVHQRLRQHQPHQYAAWIAPLKRGADEDGVLRLIAPSRFVARYVETHLMAAITEAVTVCIGTRRRILIEAESA
ncbi:MAG: DnaA N-terminal domain-containing protein [Paracoccaceae bacterium]